MNLVAAVGMVVLLGVLLAVLASWQRRIAEDERQRLAQDLDPDQGHEPPPVVATVPKIEEQGCLGCGACITACPESDVIRLVDGVAKVVHAWRCVGHALCAMACPVGAIRVGLDPMRPDLPVRTDDLETSVAGVYIAGELGGLALIRVAADEGLRAVDAVARDLAGGTSAPPTDGDPVDLLIVGAGPAGIAAALRATERGLSYTMIDQDDLGGTVRKYPRRKLTLTGPMRLPLVGEIKQRTYLKEELIAFWEQLFASHGLRMRSGVRLNGIDGQSGDFVVNTSAGPMSARRVLLAMGRRGTPRRLDVPGEELEKVQYLLCDAATYEDRRILVVGGGDSAVEAATALAAQPGNAVTIAYRRSAFFRLKPRNRDRIEKAQQEGLQVLFRSRVLHIQEESVTLSLENDEGAAAESLCLPNDFVFICAGGEPPVQLLKGIGVRMGGESDTPDAAQDASVLVAS